jgi:metal-responsive CopG/Arc/MetJ family transcriptional regulator
MRITIHLPDDLADAVKEAANLEQQSVSALTAKAIETYLVATKRRYYGALALKNASPENVTRDVLDVLHNARKENGTHRS